ncbi:hypothetical protein CCR83_11785 [Rhodobacter veldkampii DSM 11550]|uniref:VacJ lipoprotein n=1 Tax=Phaeovulum veldkampii DSM 11550 TaxID=1185920 RepID=A0A2T4JL40_9RHOB|nr:hypothetical protein [Phaeovulum veldkampii DSM 11550]PTE18616.1 hypothetical protein C5F46_03145 [Phaeovulum veldkampii DSM 11550]TDQ57238.1 phospholipid-binding lipoprotein MlaA [Phaeovulum veldkampii DSM 11550]
MPVRHIAPHIAFGRPLALLAVLAALSGCANPDAAGGGDDPWEPTNRAMHSFNKGVDRALLRPASQVYGTVLPEPVRLGVGNVAGNLQVPGAIVNNLLQGRIEAAGRNTFRFLINSTLGVAGIFDPAASSFGLPEDDSDFGETLHVWGVGEGRYVELPLAGPSTERDSWGRLVDLFIDPVGAVLKDNKAARARSLQAVDIVGDRYKFTSTIDSVLYDSADSYAQSRLLFLQNRRFQLGQAGQTDAEAIDPYEDPYAQ